MIDDTCSIEGCDRPARSRGWCVKHYSRWLRHGDPLQTKYRMDDRPECVVEGCSRQGRGANLLCGPHESKRRRENRRERDREYRKRYRARPGQRQRSSAVAQVWRATNAVHIAEYAVQYRRENPETIQAIKSRRRARERNAPVRDLTAAQWRAIKAAFDYRCVYCGRRVQRLTQDHVIPLTKGGHHTASNVVPACRPCNSRKGDRPAPAFHPMFRHLE